MVRTTSLFSRLAGIWRGFATRRAGSLALGGLGMMVAAFALTGLAPVGGAAAQEDPWSCPDDVGGLFGYASPEPRCFPSYQRKNQDGFQVTLYTDYESFDILHFLDGDSERNVPSCSGACGTMSNTSRNRCNTASGSCTITYTWEQRDGDEVTLTFELPQGTTTIRNPQVTDYSLTDVFPPRVTSITRQSPTTETTDADTLTWQVVFDEPVTTDASDFTLSGTTATLGVTSNGTPNSTYEVTASGGDLAELDGTVTLSLVAGGAVDGNGNTLTNTTPTGTNDNTYTMAQDTVAPTVTAIERLSPASETTASDTLTWRVTFSEVVQNVWLSDFVASGTTASVNEVTSNGGDEYDVTVSGGDLAAYDGVVTLGFAGGQGIRDLADNALTDTTPTGANQSYTVDNTPPAAPAAPDLDAGSDTGDSATDDVTRAATLEFSGTAESGSTVELTSSLDGVLGTAPADAGTWTLQAGGMSEGVHTITATATDGLNQTSPASAALSVTVDRTAPTIEFTAASGPFNGPFDVDVTVSAEAASSFSQSDLSVTNGTITPASFTNEGGGAFSLKVTPGSAGTVSLSTASGAVQDVAGNQSAAASISRTASAATVTLSASQATVSEAGGSVTLTATLSAGSAEATTVNLAYGGTATGSGVDHSGPTSITIPANATTGTAQLSVVNDALDEDNETLTIDIASVESGDHLAEEDGVQQVTITIEDDDSEPALSVADATASEGAGVLSHQVTLDAPSGKTVTVNYAVSGGGAVSNSDFTAASGTLTFAPGQTTKSVNVTLATDPIVELDETLTVTLSSASNATIADGEATGTITNDDTAFLVVSDITQAEGDSGTSTVEFRVETSMPIDTDVAFTATTADDGASAGADYTALNAVPFVLPARVMSVTISVTVAGDTSFEPDEAFTLTLGDLDASGRGVSFSTSTATATLTNDDAQPTVTLAASPTTISEHAGTSTLTATLSATSTQDVTVALGYSNSNVTGPATIVVPAGEASADVTLTAVDNALDEPDRQNTVSVETVTNGAEDGSQAVTLTLADDDDAPRLSAADVSLSESDAGARAMTFTVSLSAPSARTVTVDYATRDSSATAGEDYTPASGTLTFTPGDVEESFDVAVTGDRLVELDEAFAVTLASAVNASISNAHIEGVIANDDSATVAIADVLRPEGDTGTSTFDFIVTLSQATDVDLTLSASTADGSATAGRDYVAVSGEAFTIEAGTTTVTAPVTVTGDAGFEPTETFTVTLSRLDASGRSVTIDESTATGTISNDDAAPDLFLSDVTVPEDAGTATVTVTLTAAAGAPVDFTWSTVDGSAAAPGDFVAVTNAPATIPAGVTSIPLSVTLEDDAVEELEETFSLSITGLSGALAADTDAVITIEPSDIAAPEPTLSADAGPAGGPFTLSVRFSEPVTGLEVSDFNVSGASLSRLAGAGDAYTLLVTPAANGTVTVGLPAGAVVDRLGTSSTAAQPFSRRADLIAPGVTMDAAEIGRASGPFEINVTFTEAVTGFDPGDLSVANGEVSAFSGSGERYQATIMPAADGAVTIEIAAGAAQDAAGNGNTAAEALTVTADQTAPRPTIASTAANPVGGAFQIALTFTEPVSGFALDDIAVTNGAASEFAGSGESYTATITPAADGPVTVDVAAGAAADAAGNANAAAETFSIEADGTAPGVSVAADASDPVSGAFQVSVTFTEAVTGFELADLAVTNGAASELAGSGAAYTATITPEANGAVTVAVAAGAAQDAAGNGNTAAEPFSIEADGAAPGVSIATAAGDPVSGAFEISVSFTEAVTGFELSDLAVTNGAASELAGSGAAYTATITPAADGPVTVDVAAGAAADAAGNANTAAETFALTADATPPTLALETPGDQVNGVFEARFVFSEPVSDFTLDDVAVENGDAADLASADQTVFTATITPREPGAVIISVAEAAASDAAGNASLAASVDVDAVAEAPVVELMVDETVEEPGSVAASATVSNPGSAPIPFTAVADVDWLDVTPGSGVIPSLGDLEFEVTLNGRVDDLEPGEHVGRVTVTTGADAAPAGAMTRQASAMLVEIPVRLEVEQRKGSVTLVATTPSGASGEAAFGYASDIAAFDGLTLTTQAGRAEAQAGEILFGSYALAQSLPAGWRTRSVSCSGDLDGGSVFDAEAGTATIDLDPGEALVCTFENVRDDAAVRLATQRAIRGFMARRADRIVAAAPDLSRRFSQRSAAERGAFSADMDGSGRRQMSLSASLSGARNAAAQAAPEIAGVTDYERPFLEGWDVWIAAEIAGVKDDRDGADARSDFAVAQLGVDYQLSDTLIVGVLAQYDWMAEDAHAIFEEAGAIAGAQVEGEGWMAGPYAVWRLQDRLILDVLAMAGRSDNSVDPLGLYEDDFETGRYLLRANLTGEFVSPSGAWRLRPQAGLTHFEETQDGYVDSLGVAIPEQTVALGRLRAGPELVWRREGAGGSWLELTSALNAVWDYQTAELFNEAGRLTGGDDDLRADARFGLSTLSPWGALIRLEAGFAGIGIGDFEARTGRFEIRIPFGAPGAAGGGAAFAGASALGGACADALQDAGFAAAAGRTPACDRAPGP